MATEARVIEGDGGGVTTLLRAALPGVPGVNLLPGIRKTAADLDGADVHPARGGRSTATTSTATPGCAASRARTPCR